MLVSLGPSPRLERVKDLARWSVISFPFLLFLYVAWYQVIFDIRDRLTPSDALFAGAFVIAGLVAAVWVILRGSSLLAALGLSGYSIALLIGFFASLYLGSGSPDDWSRRLSQLDAITLAMGTFTTAGTYGVTPVSQTARGLVTLQMGVDVIATVVIFGLLVTRLAELRSRRDRATCPDDGAADAIPKVL
jgi:hypothetical protein